MRLNHNRKDKTILIVGAGLVGEMCAVKVLKEKPTGLSYMH